jgi:hypothetical protein
MTSAQVGFQSQQAQHPQSSRWQRVPQKMLGPGMQTRSHR